jgi:hypothetical protein
VSTSAISRPTSRKSIPTSLRRSNSQTGTLSNESSDALYQFPRKAPLPPGSNNESETGSVFSQHLSPAARPQQTSDMMRPISPQSLSSSSISRSNTFNTVSSGGTLRSTDPRSRDLSPDPKGFRSPRRVLSQKSQQTYDSLEKETNMPSATTSSPLINTNKNDWMMMSDVRQDSLMNLVHDKC